MSFKLPELYESPLFTWGPPAEEMTVDGAPFELYKKKDQLKTSDWFAVMKNSMKDKGDATKGKTSGFQEVEDTARLKALKKEKASASGKKKNTYNPNYAKKKTYYNKSKKPWVNPNRRNYITKLPDSIETTGAPLFEVHLEELSKSRSLAGVPDFVEIPGVTDAYFGRPFELNSAITKATAQRPVPLDENKQPREDEALLDIANDKIMKKLATAYMTKYPDRRMVLTSDVSLGWLMTSHLSENPWHVSIKIVGKFIVLSSDFNDVQWVSEQSGKRPSEDDRTPVSERISSLGEESTLVHKAFLGNICATAHANLKTERDPFVDVEDYRGHRRLYRYKVVSINSETNGEYGVLIRCQIDAAERKNPKKADDYKLIRAFGLLEYRFFDTNTQKYDPSSWRKPGANANTMLAQAYMDDRCKLSRWTALAFLSGADLMTVGFISRQEKKNASDPLKHEVVTTDSSPPDVLCKNFSVNIQQMWNTVDNLLKALFDLGSTTSKVVLKKPSDRRHIEIYEEMSDDEDEEDDDDDDDDEEDDEDEDDE